jgi:hypothetical protein
MTSWQIGIVIEEMRLRSYEDRSGCLPQHSSGTAGLPGMTLSPSGPDNRADSRCCIAGNPLEFPAPHAFSQTR